MQRAVADVQPVTLLLPDNQTVATIYPVVVQDQVPGDLMEFICEEFNTEIMRGATFPFLNPLPLLVFRNYWFGNFAAIMVLGDDAQLLDLGRTPPTTVTTPYPDGGGAEDAADPEWEKRCLGTFVVKPNYPGRSAHICTGSFLVNIGVRNKGIGKILMETFLDWSFRLGYRHCVFDLVYDNNRAMKALLKNAGFPELGRIAGGGVLADHVAATDIIMFSRPLQSGVDRNASSEASVAPVEGVVADNKNAPAVVTVTQVGGHTVSITVNQASAVRFQRIKYYMATGSYPEGCNKLEKAKLRASSHNYSLVGDKLMLKDKEVIIDPKEQVDLVHRMHLATNHGGINRTTSAVTEKYHWPKIKDVVIQFVKNCYKCTEHKKPPGAFSSIVENTSSTAAAQLMNGDYYFDSRGMPHVVEKQRQFRVPTGMDYHNIQTKRQKLSEIQFDSDSDDSEYSENAQHGEYHMENEDSSEEDDMYDSRSAIYELGSDNIRGVYEEYADDAAQYNSSEAENNKDSEEVGYSSDTGGESEDEYNRDDDQEAAIARALIQAAGRR